MTNNYGIRDGYTHRETPAYFSDTAADNVTWQPDVYTYAFALARAARSKMLYDVGCGNGQKLAGAPCDIIGYDFGENISIARLRYPGVTFKEINLEYGISVSPKYVLSTLICADTIEHLQNPEQLFKDLAYYMSVTSAVVISTPDRIRTYGYDHEGPPANLCHTREWSLDEIASYLRSLGANIRLAGYTRCNDLTNEMSTALLVGGIADVDFVGLAQGCGIVDIIG